MEDKEDYWGWKEKLISVPGFGYFPPKVNDELDALTEVLTLLLLAHLHSNCEPSFKF